ncbi:DNA/RNA non-specific endonuclease [Novosphingobium beihaiensis]|uniref:DNA/RNA non-specific endonuclease n=1 Tax=Novosphingobium beihaiensis TaxID=2930389 RepID=A0ABT0BVG4_9SPHN|nr:DNA/RNA non-specific endonuclease [Novosphingobium beihaiensis]MCJ2189066.1 DNA/RNA non-specific endonuclease [Novosphingobium beihaiensis]
MVEAAGSMDASGPSAANAGGGNTAFSGGFDQTGSGSAAQDMNALAAGLENQRQSDPEAAAQAIAEMEATMTPVERGQFAAALDSARASANDNALAAPDPGTLALDLGQMALDITGIVDPTPISDGSNAAISLGRSIASAVSGEWGAAGGHLANAGISAVGIVPALGDLAKAGKIGPWARTVADAVSAVAHNPALRESVEPALHAVHDAVGRIPQSALDAMPASARESIDAMRRQLDDFFAPGARQVDEAAQRALQGGVRRFDNADDFNAAANAATPNTRYEYGAYSYSTDARGRVDVAEGTLDLTPTGRNDPALQAEIGHEGKPTDVGFHLIADRFGGQTNRLNVVPGNGKPLGDGTANLNQGAFKRFENTVADLAGDGRTVEVRITAQYDAANASNRPDSFRAQYRVEGGDWITRQFTNK